MKKRLNVTVLGVLVSFAMIALTFSTAMAAKEMSLGTSAVGGIYYSLGVPISQVINKHLSEIHVTPEITTGTMENMRLLGDDKLQMALGLPRQVINARNGEKPFDKKIEVMTVIRLIPIWNLYLTLKSSGIESVSELKGKTVNVAPVGGLEVNAKAILQTYGLDYKSVKPVFLGVGAGMDALKDGKVDGSIATLPSTNQIKATHDVNILWMDEQHLKEMTEKFPGYGIWEVPPGTIKGIDKPMKGPDFGCQLNVRADADPELVYKITKTLVENISEMKEMFGPYRFLNKELAAKSLGVPFHPGAVKYFKEAGLMK